MVADQGRSRLVVASVATLVLLVIAFVSASSSPLLDEAVQLIRVNVTSGHLELTGEGRRLLEGLSQPLHVLAAIGPYKSGKSFFLNMLAGAQTGFAVGKSIKPQTKGIWIRAPLDREGKTIVLMDTEGLFSVGVESEAEVDAKVFSVALLSSSYLLFNTIKHIDTHNIDKLKLLAERSNVLRLRGASSFAVSNSSGSCSSGSCLSASPLGEFPPLLWVVQSFYQDLGSITPEQWLLQYVRTQRVDGEDSLLDKIFPSLSCEVLPIPLSDASRLSDLTAPRPNDFSAAYLRALDRLRSKIFDAIKAKTVGGKSLSGPALVMFLEQLIEAVNSAEGLPALDSLWNTFVDSADAKIRTHLAAAFKADLSKELEILKSAKEVEVVRKRRTDEALSRYEAYTQSILARKSRESAILDSLGKVFEEYKEKAAVKVEQHIKSTVAAAHSQAQSTFHSIPTPIASIDFQKSVDEGIIAFEKAMDQALFIFDTPSERALTANVVTAKKNELISISKTFVQRNAERVSGVVSQARREAEGVAISTMPSGLQCLLQAEADIAESARQARLVFEQEAKRFEREFSYAAERNALEKFLTAAREKRMKALDESVGAHLQMVSDQSFRDLLRNLQALELYTDLEELSRKLEQLRSAAESEFIASATCFVASKRLYSEALRIFQDSSKSLTTKKHDDNTKWLQEKLRVQLGRALAAVKSVADSYTILESLGNFAYRRVLLELSEFPESDLSSATKKHLASKWVEENVLTAYRSHLSIPYVTAFIAWFLDLFR